MKIGPIWPGRNKMYQKCLKRGFTLIELLVVVLIIGILASVALPQYQKAVLKSKAARVWPTLKTIDSAIQIYCLANPGSTNSLYDSLDIAIPSNFSYTQSCQILETHPSWESVGYTSSDNSFIVGGNTRIQLSIRNGKRYCGAWDGSYADQVKKICALLGMENKVSVPGESYPCYVPSYNCYSD